MWLKVFVGLLGVCSAVAQPVVGAADYSDARTTGIPRGSIFSIFAGGLADSAMPATAIPLATSLNGVSVQLTSGSVTALAPLLYVSPTQINAILPSSVPEGQCAVVVVTPSRQTSLGYIQVTAGRFSAFTVAGRGFGPAVLQRYGNAGGPPSLASLTGPAVPGSAVTLWGTGLGAAAVRDDVTVYVDGIGVKPQYAGRAPNYPGVDQINFAVPAGVRPRCFVPIAVSTGGVFSTGATLSVSTDGNSCTNDLALTRSSLAALDAGAALRIAVLSYRTTNGLQTAESWIADYDAAYLSYLVNGEGAGMPDDAALCGVDRILDGTYGLGAFTFYGNYNPTVASLPKLYGTRRDPNPLLPGITGPQNCSWIFSLERGSPTDPGIAAATSNGCPARNFQYAGLVAGSLPTDRAAADVSSFTVHGPPQSLAASWNASPVSGDSIVLLASSYIYAMAPVEHAFVCQLSSTARSFVFPQPQTGNSFAKIYNPVALSLSNISYRVFPLSSPLADFLIVRTSNATATGAQIQ